MSAARDKVRLSLRLLKTGRAIERRVDQMLRARFGFSIARFDFLAALDRHGAMSLGELSAHLLVSNGNVTGLAARLKHDGLIEAVPANGDRRVQIVSLSAAGRSAFAKMAKAHEACVGALLDQLSRSERADLMTLLDRAKAAIACAVEQEPVR